MMNISSVVPIIIFWLNIVIYAINLLNISRLMYLLRRNDNDKPYLLILLLSALALILVNTFSAINHYLVYFESGSQIRADATWMRFADRYAMLFKVIFNTLMSSQYCILWMRRFYKIKT